jgi:hypothetical protein
MLGPSQLQRLRAGQPGFVAPPLAGAYSYVEEGNAMTDNKTRFSVLLDSEDEKMLHELMERWGLDMNATVERRIDAFTALEEKEQERAIEAFKASGRMIEP